MSSTKIMTRAQIETCLVWTLGKETPLAENARTDILAHDLALRAALEKAEKERDEARRAYVAAVQRVEHDTAEQRHLEMVRILNMFFRQSGGLNFPCLAGNEKESRALIAACREPVAKAEVADPDPEFGPVTNEELDGARDGQEPVATNNARKFTSAEAATVTALSEELHKTRTALAAAEAKLAAREQAWANACKRIETPWFAKLTELSVLSSVPPRVPLEVLSGCMADLSALAAKLAERESALVAAEARIAAAMGALTRIPGWASVNDVLRAVDAAKTALRGEP